MNIEPESQNDTVLEVENLSKIFEMRRTFWDAVGRKPKQRVRAVDNISFSVANGEILGFVGESGCGKSTMGRSILRLVEPTDGRIVYNNLDITALTLKEMKEQRKHMQMIFQDPFGSLNPRRRVHETIRQTIHIHQLAEIKQEEDRLIQKVLEEVGLIPTDIFWSKYPALLSGGQLQRVSMARVLVLQPSLIIADEPVSMLDVSVRIGILDLLLQMREKYNISFIYITHDLATARYVCDRIAIMYLGKIVEIGDTETILKTPVHPYTKALITAVPVPDPTVKVGELPIKGYVPTSGTAEIEGCRFYHRCPYSEESCLQDAPQLEAVAMHHAVACFKYKQFQQVYSESGQ
jgi:peptide/nickel transport system ATP-binding protein